MHKSQQPTHRTTVLGKAQYLQTPSHWIPLGLKPEGKHLHHVQISENNRLRAERHGISAGEGLRQVAERRLQMVHTSDLKLGGNHFWGE